MTGALHPYDPARQIAALERRIADLERRLNIRQMALRPGLPSWVADTRGDSFTGDLEVDANLGVTQTLTVTGNSGFTGTVHSVAGLSTDGDVDADGSVNCLQIGVAGAIYERGFQLGSAISIDDGTKTIFLTADSGGGTGTVFCNGDVTLTSGKKFIGRIKANGAGGTEGISFGFSGANLNVYKDGTLFLTL